MGFVKASSLLGPHYVKYFKVQRMPGNSLQIARWAVRLISVSCKNGVGVF